MAIYSCHAVGACEIFHVTLEPCFYLEDNFIPSVIFLHLVGVRFRLPFCHDVTSEMSSILCQCWPITLDTECVQSAYLYCVLGIVVLHSRSMLFLLREELSAAYYSPFFLAFFLTGSLTV